MTHNPRDTTITCTKASRIRARVLSAHLGVPMWIAIDMAITEMLRKHNFPEPLVLQQQVDNSE